MNEKSYSDEGDENTDSDEYNINKIPYYEEEEECNHYKKFYACGCIESSNYGEYNITMNRVCDYHNKDSDHQYQSNRINKCLKKLMKAKLKIYHEKNPLDISDSSY